MEARKMKEKEENKELEEKEKNFNQYVNGPNKDIPSNKERYIKKKQMKNQIDVKRRMWNLPLDVMVFKAY